MEKSFDRYNTRDLVFQIINTIYYFSYTKKLLFKPVLE